MDGKLLAYVYVDGGVLVSCVVNENISMDKKVSS